MANEENTKQIIRDLLVLVKDSQWKYRVVDETRYCKICVPPKSPYWRDQEAHHPECKILRAIEQSERYLNS